MVKPWQLLVRDVFFRPVMRILFLQYLPRYRVKKAVIDSSSTEVILETDLRLLSAPPLQIFVELMSRMGTYDTVNTRI